MDIEHLQSLYYNNIGNIFNADRFKDLASHSSNIQGYSFINRVLLHIQNKYATDVKSAESWEISGRTVKSEAMPMGILAAIRDIKYLDAESMHEADTSCLSHNEFNKALELGIIIRREEIIGIKANPVYDISDTQSLLDAKNSKARKLKIPTIFNIIKSFGICVVKTGNRDTTFDYDSNTLYINEYVVEDVMNASIDALVYNYVLHIEKGMVLREEEKELMSKYIKYAVFTYFSIDISIDFDDVANIYNRRVNDNTLQDLINILDMAEELVNSIIFEHEDELESRGEEYRSNIAKRASILLNIMEANYRMVKIKGG